MWALLQFLQILNAKLMQIDYSHHRHYLTLDKLDGKPFYN